MLTTRHLLIPVTFDDNVTDIDSVAAALDVCLTIVASKGSVLEEYGPVNIGDTVVPAPVVVVLEGGLVQTVGCTTGLAAPVVVIDYDTEGCDPDDDVVDVPQGEHRAPAKAAVTTWPTPETLATNIAEFAATTVAANA